VDMRVGRVTRSRSSRRRVRPAWKLTIDFGDEVGVKRSSAQIRRYSPPGAGGRLVVAVVNFPPRRIGAFESEVLVLGALDPERGVVLLATRPEDVAARRANRLAGCSRRPPPHLAGGSGRLSGGPRGR